jgi:antitoxin (DNA-binding transcriptional repressor) of toxin-antitoxin stability system
MIAILNTDKGCFMRNVSVAELKNRLSKYLALAKGGEEIIILDRNLPVAKPVPFSSEEGTEEELLLVAADKMRLPERPSALVPLSLHESRSRPAHAQLRNFLPVCGGGVSWKSTPQSQDSNASADRCRCTKGSVSTRTAKPRLEGDSPWRHVRELATRLLDASRIASS